eukprot:4123684-Pleurochrysis_carterae.AAC.1
MGCAWRRQPSGVRGGSEYTRARLLRIHLMCVSFLTSHSVWVASKSTVLTTARERIRSHVRDLSNACT